MERASARMSDFITRGLDAETGDEEARGVRSAARRSAVLPRGIALAADGPLHTTRARCLNSLRTLASCGSKPAERTFAPGPSRGDEIEERADRAGGRRCRSGGRRRRAQDGHA